MRAAEEQPMNTTYNCPACGKMHEAKRLAQTNWFGDRADPDEIWAIGWCHEAGRETGDRVPLPYQDKTK